MARYFLTAQTLSLTCGQLHIDMFSKPDEHLWLLWTTKTPRTRRNLDRRQANLVTHSNNYLMFIEGVVEQNEPGITFHHTFDFTWPKGATEIWFYTINKSTGSAKQTRSPIFAYEFSDFITLTEPFVGGQLNPLMGWQGNPFGNQQSSNINGGHWTGSHQVPPNGPGTMLYLQSNVSPPLAFTSPCRTTIVFSFNGDYVGNFYSAGGLLVTMDDPIGGGHWDLFLQAGTGTNEPAFNPMQGPDTGWLALGSGVHTYTLQDLMDITPTNLFGYTNPTSPTTQLQALGYMNPQGQLLVGQANFNFGPIQVLDNNAAFKDDSRFWQHKHVQPVLP